MKENKNKNKIVDYVIIGNSAAGVAAAENIRKSDKNGSIAILTYESYKNYSKPLITYFLAGKVSLDKIYFKEEKFYSGNNLMLHVNSEVVSVDEKSRCLVTSDGKEFFYNKLLIASGGKPIIPEIKVTEKDNKSYIINSENYSKIKGIFTLTTLKDAIKLKKYINENKISSVSILGGGLIGLKTAEAMLELGLQISIIELSDRILSASFDNNASEIIESKIESCNGSIFTNATIDEIFLDDGRISFIKLRNGKKIACNLLVIAVGVKPNVDMLLKLKNFEGNFGDSSGFSVSSNFSNGIIVDSFMQTPIDNIYAAGDVIQSSDRLSGEQKNIAIWPLAVKQGSIAGINMAGGNIKYRGGFFMNSIEIMGIPSISIGLNNLDDKISEGIKVFKEFNPEKNLYRKVTIRDNRVIGAILVGNIERAGIYAGLISNDIDISGVAGNIAKEDFGIIQLPAEYRKHLVVGEGIEV